MLYEEFLLRLAELVEECEDQSFYLCHFCDEVEYQLRGLASTSLSKYARPAKQMLKEHPQWLGLIADHAECLKIRIHEIEAEHGAFIDYLGSILPYTRPNERRVAWLREEAA